MTQNVSPYLEGNSNYSIFYTLKNGNVLQVANLGYDSDAEMNAAVKADPEHAKEISNGEIYSAIEYNPAGIIQAFEDSKYESLREIMDPFVGFVRDYGVFYGRDARTNGLFDALEKANRVVEGRYTPSTTDVVDFIDPKEYSEKEKQVAEILIDGVDEYDMETIHATVTMENGETYKLSYDAANDTLYIFDEDMDSEITRFEPGYFYSHDQVQMNIHDAFEVLKEEGISLEPEIDKMGINYYDNDGEEWISGFFKIGEGEHPYVQFSYNIETEELNLSRNMGCYEGPCPNHFEAALCERATDMLDSFLENSREQHAAKSKSRER